MPIFTVIITFIIGLPFAIILDKGIILGIAMLVGIVADVTFWIILEIKDKDKPDSGFAIDWGA